MITFFPDLNVWLALSVAGHLHSADAWNWMRLLPEKARLVFSRYTQVGLLRLLTNQAVMGEQTLTLGRAWGVYENWLRDPRVEFYPEPRGLDAAFRRVTRPFLGKQASKSIGDCFLLAFAQEADAVLVTFDAGLQRQARRQHHPAICPLEVVI
jgi:uncharacterized protein